MSDEEQISILLVEDHEIVRLGLRLALGKLSTFRIVGEASDGESAVRLASLTRPQVVLMDIGLPVFDGIEATRRIKERLPQTRILMLTSHNDDTELIACFRAGADGYCMKGRTPSQIGDAIKAVFQGAAWLDQDVADKVLSGYRIAPEPVSLSEREQEVVKLLPDGLSIKEMAGELGIGPDTVKMHIRNSMQKLGVTNRTQLVLEIIRRGLA